MLDRRRFLQATVGVVAGGAWRIPTAIAEVPGADLGPSGDASTDVVVIGGGFAGIAAARGVLAAGKSVVLVEARDRLGGRTRSETLRDGVTIDVGGQWIGPQQHRMNALAQQFGIETFPTWNEGNNLLIDEGVSQSYQGTIPKLSLLPLLELGVVQARLERLAAAVNLEAPWDTPGAASLDGQTLAGWLEANLWTGAARRILRVGLEVVMACDLRRISLLHALFVIKSGVNLDVLFGVANGAQQDRFRHGTASLVQAMIAPLRGAIRLASPVDAIQQDANSVTVVTARGRVRAQRAVVAMAPALAGRIDFAPALTADRDQLMQANPMGSVVKCMAIYDRPFWREQGLSGQLVVTDGPISATFDNSVPGATTGILLGFAVGPQAEQLRRLDAATRRRAVLEVYARAFGPAAAQPVDYLDHSWADEPWSRGCYFGHFPPGVLTSLGPVLRRAEGRIHWAGTETAREWTGYIEGAVESGERVAAEVAV